MSDEEIRILLVEDNPGDARFLREILQDEYATQFEFVFTERLDNALIQLDLDTFDVVLCDLSLPDTQGLDTLKRLHAHAPDIPVVVLTGMDDMQLGLKAVQAGAQDYLVKDRVDGNLVARTLRYAVERQRTTVEMERMQHQQLELKERFISHVSHELRSPLTTIHQFVTILLDGLAGEMNPSQREYLEITLRNVNQLRTMIRDLTDASRANTGKLNVELQSVSLVELISQTVRTYHEIAARRGVYLIVYDFPYLPPVLAEGPRILQVLNNLLENALKFTPPGGTVAIQASADPKNSHFVLVSVMDTGCGISPEGLTQVFERLYQEENSAPSSRKGLGIGLYICKELIENHHGKIWAESKLQEGSVFHFTLQKVSFEYLLAPVMANALRSPNRPALLAIGIYSESLTVETRLAENVRQRLWENLQRHCQSPEAVLLPRVSSFAQLEILHIVTMLPEMEEDKFKEHIHASLRQDEPRLDCEYPFRIDSYPISLPDEVVKLFPSERLKSVSASVETLIEMIAEEWRTQNGR